MRFFASVPDIDLVATGGPGFWLGALIVVVVALALCGGPPRAGQLTGEPTVEYQPEDDPEETA